ncbi:MAG: RNA polymerase sigma factor RpoH [Betaproteobacteria bacterium]|nr:RNA polymerase sigma factor RpoH [Betaproteobacteria bacterium]
MTNALTINNLPPIASLDLYIQAVNRIPLLSASEELGLAKRLKEEEDLDAAKSLVMSHLRLVVSIARRFNGYGLPFGDLIQEGNVGLMKAVKRYDFENGARLVSFAMHWIKAEIHEFVLKNWRIVKVATTKAQRKLFFNLRSMRSSLDTLNNDEIDRISHELDVKPTDVTEMETRMSGADLALDPFSSNEDDDYSPLSYLPSPDLDPFEVLEKKQMGVAQHQGLTKALSDLDERSRTIIQSRWLKEENQATLHQLAEKYGVSAERIRQIEVQAMKKMKAAITQ